MAAMSMRASMSYNVPLVLVSVLIAIVAGTAALWIGTWVRGIGATVGAALIMGVAVSGMHYTGMAALRLTAGPGSAVPSGATAGSFLIPLLVTISLATFLLVLAISLTPSEDEIRADAEMRRLLADLERRAGASQP
jgi:NO-binding membrane sensor protein with MHYT domain